MCECEILSHSSCSQILPWWEEMELQRVENRFVVGKDAKLQLYPFQLCSLLMGRAIPNSTSSPRVPRLFTAPPPRCKDKENRRTTCKWQCLSSSYLDLYERGWFWECGARTLRPQNADITWQAMNPRLMFLGRRTRLSPLLGESYVICFLFKFSLLPRKPCLALPAIGRCC